MFTEADSTEMARITCPPHPLHELLKTVTLKTVSIDK
jgi:hypothetical protein